MIMTAGWPIKFAPIAAAGSGDNSLVAAVTGKRFRVHAFALSFAGTVDAKFQSAASDLTGLFYGVANNQVVAPYCEEGLFQTAVGEALELNLSAAIAVGGYLVYSEVG
jgi:hypothetical protein